jgi:hypothetical protein
MSHIHWVARGTGTPKDRDEVHKREVYECDGWVCDLDVMGVPSKLTVIRKDDALTRARATLLLSCWAKTARRKWNSPLVDCARWTPEGAKKRSVSRRIYMSHIHFIPTLFTLFTLGGQVYLQQNKKKEETKGKNCHVKTMWSLEKPI